MIVQKFGGTSVGSAERINQVLDIASSNLESGLVLVASAMGKSTDALVRIGAFAEKGLKDEAKRELDAMWTLHRESMESLLSETQRPAAEAAVGELFQELEGLVKGLILIQEVSLRSMDTLLSFGERLSTTLIHFRALDRGINSQLLDSRSFVKTDSEHGKANLVQPQCDETIRKAVNPEPGKLLVAQGFIGSDERGITTTLGRGGSDYSATIIGAALGAEEVQIWTDVDGIMTSDPRVIPAARTIDALSYSEAAELSYFGAKVIHPSTIQPAVKLGIPVLVKNTGNPEGAGSRIDSMGSGAGLQAIAGKKPVTLINIQSSRMLNAYGFLKRIFAIFENHRISVDLIATSEVSVSLTVENEKLPEGLVSDLEDFSEVTVETGLAIVSLVGKDVWKQSSFTARVFTALDGIPVRMISLGSSDINLSLVVPADCLDKAIQSLHDALIDSRS